MKKIFIIALIISSIFCFGCSHKGDSETMVKLNKIDISALSNRKIKNIIDDSSLEEGVYQINTKSNTYIYFLGVKNEFTDIKCDIEDDTLNIGASLNKKDNSKELSQKLFVVYQKNNTVSDDKANYYDNIKLTVDGKASSFKSIITID